MASLIEMDLFSDNEDSNEELLMGESDFFALDSKMEDFFDTNASLPKQSPPAVEQTAQMAPRMVSVDSMPSMAAQMKSKASKPTPYDSLKSLVESKKNNTLKRTAWGMTSSPSMLNATFNLIPTEETKPSSFLRQAFYGNKTTETAPKRRKVQPVLSLHQACAEGSIEEIEAALSGDATAAGKPLSISTEKQVYNRVTNKVEKKSVKASYSFALNLALQKKLDAETIDKLVEAAPEVLSVADGQSREYSLHVLLKNMPEDLTSVDMILLKNPSVVSLTDRHFNTALHIACANGASIDIIRHLCILYPEALTMRNFHGQTPVELARRGAVCSDEVSEYLWEKLAESA